MNFILNSMKIDKRIFNVVLIIWGGCLLLSSCKKFNDWETTDSHNRLFRPSTLTATVSGVTVTLKWKSMPLVNTYVVEVSQDSLQFDNILSIYKTTGTESGSSLLFEIPELDQTTQYSARVKGVDTTGVKSDSGWAIVEFKTKKK